ncbi:hypothetical protein ACFSQ7_43125 [Paenibacillus rhizoplanae]
MAVQLIDLSVHMEQNPGELAPVRVRADRPSGGSGPLRPSIRREPEGLPG